MIDILRPYLFLLLLIPLKSFALTCYQGTDSKGPVTATAQLPSDLYVLASTPERAVIWQSSTITTTFTCYSAVNEPIWLWVNPSRATIATGADVAIVLNGTTYTQKDGKIFSGFYTNDYYGIALYRKTFTITYSLMLLRKGAAPNSGQTIINNYAVFQLDGQNGINGDPGKNFRHLVNGSVKFTRGTCSLRVGDATKTVDLQPVLIKNLPPVGGTAARAPFSLQVGNCDEGVKGASFAFTGTPDPNNAKALANTGTATGIALYLGSAADNTIITPTGTGNTRVAPLLGTTATLDLYAEYVVTRPTPTPGSVRSQSTFSITYQ
ncbi:fimbrial protein [Burkholderia cenocepacia]|jgi:type 1 fimbria pilin|uniref:fimbrial protein n=1 Tax=Burkholderia cenocepacia TaxID=95486 RepID=UPI001B97191F|nr:fimbrial protein [Burkholderia cenocepacia]MBR8095482.1 type 1 fimbrial protein [Burkholderia cenocepacia]MDI9686220.1 fimbrial protein [Burkholderia cenocepacia]HEP6427489.1 type 1 fimbrial protein [Burkholderia cenocepacia]